MALIEKISEMKQSGMSENRIMTALMEEGFSPREISEAVSQSDIKAAVGDNSSMNSGELQPSIMAESPEQTLSIPAPNYSSQPTQQYAPEPQYAPQQYQQPGPQFAQPQQYPQEQYAPQQYQEQQGYDPAAYGQQYPDQQYYQPTMDLETIRDISKQQIDEAMKKTREQVESLAKFKSELNFQVQNMENRLQKIEAVIQDIQRAVIRKMGEYGESISSISKEMRATQQSFSKVLNPLLDKQRGMNHQENESFEQPKQKPQQNQQSQKQKNSQQQNNQQNSQHQSRPSQGKNSATFEDYFR